MINLAPQAADLTDLFSVEAFLGLPAGNPDEQLLQMLISAASVAATEYIGHPLMYPVIGDWAANKRYINGALIIPTAANAGGYTFRATQSGISGPTEPASWPQTVGSTQTDGTTSWANVGLGVNVSESRSGTGQRSMMLRQFPVIGDIGSVELYGTFLTLSTSDSVDGALMIVFGTRQRAEVDLRGITVARGYSPLLFSCGQLNVRFNYAYGYWTPGQAITLNGGNAQSPAAPPDGVSTLPFDLKEAVTESAALRYRQKGKWGDSSVGEGPQRITYFMSEFRDSTKNVLNRYSDKVPLI